MSFIPESEIQDSETLYRAIHPSFWNYEEDKPTSALFKDRKGVSVDREGGKLNAGQTRRVGTYLKPDKTPENVFHALILESESKILLSSRKAKELSRMINIITPPVNNKPTQSS